MGYKGATGRNSERDMDRKTDIKDKQVDKLTEKSTHVLQQNAAPGQAIKMDRG